MDHVINMLDAKTSLSKLLQALESGAETEFIIEEALAWAADLPDSQERARVLSTAAKQWARQQPLAASEWLSERRGTSEYDLSARCVAWSVVGLDPDLAFSQVGVMQSASLRRETFEQLGRFWISDQPQAAEAFLHGENPLPADIRASLLSHFQ